MHVFSRFKGVKIISYIMGGNEQIGMLIHSDHSCGETESYIEYYSQAVFDQFNDNSCIAFNTVDKVIVLFSYTHYVIVNGSPC